MQLQFKFTGEVFLQQVVGERERGGITWLEEGDCGLDSPGGGHPPDPVLA